MTIPPPKNSRVALLKDSSALEHLDNDDSNVFLKSFIDQYVHRPQELEFMCPAKFVSTLATNYNPAEDDENNGKDIY